MRRHPDPDALLDPWSEVSPVTGRSGPRFVLVRWLPSWIGAIALPPVGVFIRRGRDSEGVRLHELVHWRQYLERGVLRYYLGYLWEWVHVGCSYEDHPWEIEARRMSGTR